MFEYFTDARRRDMRTFLCSHIRKDLPQVMEEGIILAGYLDNNIMNELKKDSNLGNIGGVVCVCVNYKANTKS